MKRTSFPALLAIVAGISVVSARQAPTPAASPNPQSVRPTFQSNVDVTVVDFRVTDYSGNFISDIQQHEIVVREDGKEQPVFMFRLVTAPAVRTDLSSSRLRGSDVESNTGLDDGHAYMLVLDDVHNHPLGTSGVKEIARDFVEHHLSDADQVSIVPLSGRRSMIRPFTRNRETMLESIDQVLNGFGDGGDRSIYLTSLMQSMSNIEGRRKAMVLIAQQVEGILRPFNPDLPEFLAASKRGNVSMYIVDPTGVPTAPAKGFTPAPITGATYSNFRKGGLGVLAEATGGLAFGLASNDFYAAFDQIIKENGSYYLLAYPSTNRSDGQLHNIEVFLKRPRVKVRARSGYLADEPAKVAAMPPAGEAAPRNITQLLSSPVAVSGLTLNVSAVPMRGTSLSTSAIDVVLDVGADDLAYTESIAGRFTGALNVHIVATDQDNKIVAEERALATMSLGADAGQRLQQSGVRVVSSLNVKKPGRYHVKIAAADANGGRVGGLVFYDLVVPAFWKTSLTMSGIVLGAKSTAGVPTMGSAVARWDAGATPPTTIRTFGPDDEIRSYVEVYGESTVERPISIETTLRDSSGAAVFTRGDRLPSASTTLTPVATDVSMKELLPGDYTLSVMARRDNSSGEVVRRDIPIRRVP